MSEPLSIVLGPHGQVNDLREGRVTLAGTELRFVDVKRMPDAYRAMARTQPYDICEMAPTSYLMAREAGAPITALALPMTRRFRHRGIQRLETSAIRQPKDLEGQRVGVRAYAVTAAVWTRGIYEDDFGVDSSKITWLTEEDENVSVALPANVQRIAPDQTLARVMASGELEAAFAGLAGVANPSLVEIVDNVDEHERAWFEKTGIYPLHGVIVVRDEILAQRPALVGALFDAFTQSKENYLERIRSEQATEAEDRRYLKLAMLVGDPLPYGLEANVETFAALVRYAHRQGLVSREPRVAEVFQQPNTARPVQLPGVGR